MCSPALTLRPRPHLRPELNRLLLLRAVRPDRLNLAMSRFVTGQLGAKYVTSNADDLERSYAVRASLPPHNFLPWGAVRSWKELFSWFLVPMDLG